MTDGRFRNRMTLALYHGERVRGFSGALQERAQNKLKFVVAAARLQDLVVPPGNRLEALRGDRKGQHSIRINDQWRICFRWDGTRAVDIEVVDYH
jgi:toxin HigB-1